MPEPFKNLFNPKMITGMGEHLHRVNEDFDAHRFAKLASDDLDKLELKERSNQICDALLATLPEDFRAACKVLTDALHPIDDAELSDMQMDDDGIRGWSVMPMADFIARRGLDDFDHALDVLGDLTKRFSAEFAIRYFFVADPERALAKAHQWTGDENLHLRRLASEGSRPRLPWGLQLASYVKEPTPLIGLLEKLKDDSEEYVRRSVANNLNDIAKDHPDTVAAIAANWLTDASADRQRLVKHACRSLIKNGHKPTLEALGYSTPEIVIDRLELKTQKVKLGGMLEFEVVLTSTAEKTQPLIVDFVIHHRKANGGTSPKTFKWKILDLAPGKSLKIAKKHSMKHVTTRTYHAGEHGLEIQINGESFGRRDFEFSL